MLDKTHKVRGYFKYTLKDAKTGEIVDQYEEPNQIMSTVPKMYFELVSGLKTPGTVDANGTPTADVPSTLKAEDFELCALVLGDQGSEKLLDGQGNPVKDPNDPTKDVFVSRKINPDDRVIGAMKKVNGKFAGTSYQATWEKLTEHDAQLPARTDPKIGCKILTEGEMDENGYTNFNKAGDNTSTNTGSENGLDVVTNVKDGVITFNFSLLEKTGKGIKFSEAALYVKHNRDEGFVKPGQAFDTSKYPGDPRDPSVAGYAGTDIPSLGTIFSMKTFKPVEKTSACVLELEWKLDFNL